MFSDETKFTKNNKRKLANAALTFVMTINWIRFIINDLHLTLNRWTLLPALQLLYWKNRFLKEYFRKNP